MSSVSTQRTLGRLSLDSDKNVWKLSCEPHVAMWAKRIFNRIPANRHGEFELSNTPSVCRDLEWFAQRFPLEIEDQTALEASARQHREHIASLDELIDPDYEPPEFELELPARDYQRRAAELFLRQQSLLLADDVGLGKTVSAIAALSDQRTLPAIVVCLPHLQEQWRRELERFLGDVRVHIVKSMVVYPLPEFFGHGPDVVILSYHKLRTWSQTLAKYGRSIIFDEIQEVRRPISQKYGAAQYLSQKIHFRMGLSATPIYNYGGEMYNVLELLFPGALGSEEEFLREWCRGSYDKDKLKDAEAFGAWLKENHYMLRRTRHEVGRELLPLTKITQPIDCDVEPLKDIREAAGELARIILSEQKQVDGDKMRASEEFSVLLRQATGIAKAPHVAAFVQMLLESGEKVVLGGWHRAVYDIWLAKLKQHNPVMYTGTETAAQKDAAVRAFVNDETDLLILSLRSGAGIDGLQYKCRTTVLGEFDWSPGVHEQFIGRIFRDGQPDPVMAYFMLSEGGVDPLMAETLGLKSEQIAGVRGDGRDLVERKSSTAGLKELARAYLGKD